MSEEELHKQVVSKLESALTNLERDYSNKSCENYASELIALIQAECARELRDFIEAACDWSDDLESWVVLKAHLLELANTWEGK
jgi:hypothetical protein